MSIKAARQGRQQAPGRPRTVESVQIFHAITSVLEQNGFQGLTLEAIAREVGCSAPAISQRFGSKGGALDAYMTWVDQQVVERFDSLDPTGEQSPLDALLARYQIPIDDRREEFSIILADPRYTVSSGKPVMDAVHSVWHQETVRMLRLAQQAGELVEVDVVMLADILISAMMGITIQSDHAERDTLVDRYLAVSEFILKPYRQPRDS